MSWERVDLTKTKQTIIFIYKRNLGLKVTWKLIIKNMLIICL